jgi:hypothetical protein
MHDLADVAPTIAFSWQTKAENSREQFDQRAVVALGPTHIDQLLNMRAETGSP